MKNIGFRNVLAGILAASCCTQLTPLAAAATLTFTKFADPNIPFPSKGAIGFTYAGNKFVGSVYSGGQLYSTDLTGGSVAAFGPATVLNSGTFEHYVTSSLGLGGFPLRDIYVGDIRCTVGSCVLNDPNLENSIVHITNDGTSSNKFVGGLCASGGICGAVRAILFDSVGTFGYNMLVSTTLGNIYQITSGATVTLLASVGEDSEGMDIIPSGAIFGSFAGQLIVASETSGFLRAITPAGVVTVLNPSAPIKSAEVVVFVPTDFGLSGNSLEGLYEANFAFAPTTAVWKADPSQFRGDLIVTAEVGSPQALIVDIHWDGTKFVQTSLGTFLPQPEDGILVTPAILAGGCTSSFVSGCCLGPVPCPGATTPSDFYSFLATVTLAGAASCTETVTSATTGVVVESSGPSTLAAGINLVTGTFSAPQTSSPFSLTISCSGASGVLCSTTLTAPLPACQPVPPGNNTGTLTIRKVVDVQPGQTTPPTAFSISVSCGGNVTQLSLSSGQQQTLTQPAGTSCTVSETQSPSFSTAACPKSLATWLPPTFSPSATAVISSSLAQLLVVHNPFKCGIP